MKRLPKKLNPILEPYLPRFREILWIKSGFQEAFTQDFKQFYDVTYRQSIDYFQSMSKLILEYPSRKQVDGLMEMLLFVMTFNFFVQSDHYDGLLENVFNANAGNLKPDEKAAIQKRYDKFKLKYKKWCDAYIEKCSIDASMLPTEVIDHSVYSSNGFAYEIKQTFKHYFDTSKTLNAPEIIDFNWSNLSIHDLHTKLLRRESEVRTALKKSGQLLPKGQTMIEFEDGAKWVYIPKPTCGELASEGDHCATVEGWMGSNFGRLLYFADSEGNLKLTASYCHLNDWYKTKAEIAELIEGRDYGVLGQIRGNHNTKPKPEYIKYVAALLADERVIFHIADSYRCNDQFLLSDIDDIQRGVINSRNPSIFDFEEAAKFVSVRSLRVLFSLFSEKAFKLDMKQEIDPSKPNPDARFIFWKGDAEDFFDDLGQEQSKTLFKFLKSGDDLFDYDYHKEDIENFIEDLDEDELKKVYDKLVELNQNTVGWHKPDLKSAKDILKSVRDCDEMERAIGGAIMSGYRAGSETEAFKQLESRVTDLADALRDLRGIEMTNDSLYGDNGIILTITVTELLKSFGIAEDISAIEGNFDSSLSHVAEAIDADIQESRNQYDHYYEYDSEAAKEDFFGYRLLDI